MILSTKAWSFNLMPLLFLKKKFSFSDRFACVFFFGDYFVTPFHLVEFLFIPNFDISGFSFHLTEIMV
jgi:hypothetical protein